MKFIFTLLTLFVSLFVSAQVGINTTAPAASLEIKSSNEAAPASTDGLIIPKVDAFPATNPLVAQQGMLVYLKNTYGPNAPGFYYWNNPTATWLPIGNNDKSWSTSGNTGINATNFIGTVNVADVYFRRGNVPSGQIGAYRTAFGYNALNVATGGNYNTAIGVNALSVSTGHENTAVGYDALPANTTGAYNAAYSRASLLLNTQGINNSAYGYQSLRNNTIGSENTGMGRMALFNNTTGDHNTAFGKEALDTNTTGSQNTTLGYNADVSTGNLTNATAIGANAEVSASNSIVLGSISGVNDATASANVGIGTTNPQERLHVVGKLRLADGTQGNGRILTSNGLGSTTWVNPNTIASGTLDQAYDFGGAGLGRTITADAGAVTISGTDGLVATGTLGSGAIAPAVGAGVRMFWNPRKAAFRAGSISTTAWTDSGIGEYSVAMGRDAIARGTGSVTLGWNSEANLNGSVAIGYENEATANYGIAMGSYCRAIGNNSLALGFGARAEGFASNAIGYYNTGFGNVSTVTGVSNAAYSYGETVLGIGATAYTPSANGASQFRAANATDRLLVVGGAIDNDNSGHITTDERRNVLVILKNGDTGIGTSTPGGLFELSLNEGRKPGTNTWTVVSDERLKTVSGSFDKGLSEILKLKPIRYHYKNSGTRQFEREVLDTEFSGFLAQEVQKIFPEAVGTDADGFLNLDIHPILIASVNALQTLDEKNKKLEAENQKLQTQAAEQNHKMAEILKRLETLERKANP